jgi:hypothetical protein
VWLWGRLVSPSCRALGDSTPEAELQHRHLQVVAEHINCSIALLVMLQLAPPLGGQIRARLLYSPVAKNRFKVNTVFLWTVPLHLASTIEMIWRRSSVPLPPH